MPVLSLISAILAWTTVTRPCACTSVIGELHVRYLAATVQAKKAQRTASAVLSTLAWLPQRDIYMTTTHYVVQFTSQTTVRKKPLSAQQPRPTIVNIHECPQRKRRKEVPRVRTV